MRRMFLFTLVVVAFALVGCQGGMQRTVGTAAAFTSAQQPMPQPAAHPPVVAGYETMPAPETGPDGERVIQMVRLPKGVTPQDMGMDAAPPAGVPAPVFVESAPEPSLDTTSPPDATGPNGERVLKRVVLPKGQTPYDAGLADAPIAAE